MTQEALRMALEALEEVKSWKIWNDCFDKEITAIKEALAQPERDYERGVIDGMQKQMQRTWVGLTDDEHCTGMERILGN